MEQKIHFFAFDLPHSDVVQAYAEKATEAFSAEHTAAFGFFGGVPNSILDDDTRIAVARILGDGTRKSTRVFNELQSHFLFEGQFGRPGKDNDKRNAERLVGWIRRHPLAPMPRVASLSVPNAELLDGCRRRLGDPLRGQSETIGERLVRDLAVFQALPATPYDACQKKPGRSAPGRRYTIAIPTTRCRSPSDTTRS
ncbi:MAG TPA: hypothetical protein VII91_07575 [Bauldia sp.]